MHLIHTLVYMNDHVIYMYRNVIKAFIYFIVQCSSPFSICKIILLEKCLFIHVIFSYLY